MSDANGPKHAPAGSAKGGQFVSAGGGAGSGKKPANKTGEKLQDPEKNSGRSRNSAPVAKLNGNELGIKPGESIKEAALRYYAALKKSPANREGFGKVEFTRKGQDKLNSSALSDPEKLKLLPAVKNIIERGDYIGHVKGKGAVVAYHYFEGNVSIGGTKKFVGVTVGEDNRGNKFYNLNENPDVLLGKRKARELAQNSAGGRGPSNDSVPEVLNLIIVPFSDVVNGKNKRRRLLTGIKALLAARGMAMDAEKTRTGGIKPHRLVFDKSTVRRVDANGFLHVALCHISKECVNPYYGREIPGFAAQGLEAGKIYYGYRSGVELAKGAATFNGLPLMQEHHADSAENPQKEYRAGSLGTDAAFLAPYLNNSLTVTDAEAIRAIESGAARELSAAYQYDPDFTPGTFQGERYDFIMTNIRGNHVALVEEGRAGPDVLVADAQIQPSNLLRRTSMGLKELIAKMKEFIASAEKQDATVDPDASTAEGKTLGDADPPLDEGGGGSKSEAAGKPRNQSDAADDDDSSDEIAELLRKLEALLRGKDGGDNDADPDAASDADKTEDPKEKAARDENAPDKKDGVALDAAMRKRLGKLATDIKTIKAETAKEARLHFKSLFEAARKVAPLCGDLDPMAFDSAADIYKHALENAGIKAETKDTAALRDMVGMACDAAINRETALRDAANSAPRAFDGPFAHLKKIHIQA